nr:MAG TPA: YopX protein [Caudoviricetes sp.]
MRQILFRGKADNNKWVYGYYCYIELFDKSGDEHLIVEHSADGSSHRVIPETVGQYTGLTDKNGKKIFEGDIVKGAWGTIFIVFYDENFLQFRAKPQSGIERDIDYYQGHNGFEIIGNIHDNSLSEFKE